MQRIYLITRYINLIVNYWPKKNEEILVENYTSD